MSGTFIGYLIGYIIAIVGVGYGLHAAGIGQTWITAIVLVLIGLGIVYALSRSQLDKTTSHPRNTTTRTTTHETRDPADRV